MSYSTTEQAIRGQGSFGIHRYVLAAFSVLAAIGVQVALSPSPNLVIPLFISLLAVIVTAYFAGRGPALFATAANLLVNCYFFARPQFSSGLADSAAHSADFWRLAVFAAFGLPDTLAP